MLKRWLPDAESIKSNRWVRWLGPALYSSRLWRMSRRGLALGIALGVFFGLLVPVAQIPLSATAAVALRANVPAAVASTLVTNPVTFGPVYYLAWRVGAALLGDTASPPPDTGPPSPGARPAPADSDTVPQQPSNTADESRRQSLTGRVLGVGKPLMLGLAVLAVTLGIGTYFIVSIGWRLYRRWQKRRR
ncbi:MAG: DUF2062 domain-containing protein [Lautropia sp.]|nr:DUF2062 domain-containing protein [Lautropia sp.]